MSKASRKRENLIYLFAWLLIYIVAFASMAAMFISESANHPLLKALQRSAEGIAPFLILFLIHNYLIAPLLVDKNKKALYLVLTLALIGVYTAFFFTKMPGRFEFGGPEEMVGMGPGPRRPGDMEPEGQRPPEIPGENGGPARDRIFLPPPRVMNVAVVILLIVANLGVKFSVKQSDNKTRMEQLEKENLNQQLQYLRYQINPHFFMNTLNNIHALVDIDPKEAKECIVELSKLMRYILYEGSKPTIPLDKETEFLKQYVALMRIRYQDNVKINVSLPEDVPGVEIPPLLFISFVENAFKHGISYDEDSFINVHMDVRGGRLYFDCENSRHESHQDGHKGIGMENVRKRLNLLYGSNYVLDVKSDEKRYEIFVEIPINYEKPDKS
jgi:hypothetical protein